MARGRIVNRKMDGYLRRYMADPRHRSATAGPMNWWDEYAPVEERWYGRMDPAQAKTVSGGAGAAGQHSLKTVRHNASKRCWEGYEATPGKKPYSDGSCQKKGGDSGSASYSSESDGEGGRRKKEKKEKKTEKTETKEASS